MFDLTGLKVLKEASESARLKGILVVFIQIHPELVALLRKFDIRNDYSTPLVDVDTYLALSKGLEFINPPIDAIFEEENNALLVKSTEEIEVYPLQDMYHRVQTENDDSKKEDDDLENVMKSYENYFKLTIVIGFADCVRIFSYISQTSKMMWSFLFFKLSLNF